MELKKSCLGEHFTSYDDLKEKMKKYEEENFVTFFQWFCNCLRLKNVLNQLYSKVCAKSIQS